MGGGSGVRKIYQYSLSKCSLTGPMAGVSEEIEGFEEATIDEDSNEEGDEFKCKELIEVHNL